MEPTAEQMVSMTNMGSVLDDAEVPESWQEILLEELGVSSSTHWRSIAMTDPKEDQDMVGKLRMKESGKAPGLGLKSQISKQ